jgi:hypothetical protein
MQKYLSQIGSRPGIDVNEIWRMDPCYLRRILELGYDVKMYTVGPEYGHARSAQVSDGRWQEITDGIRMEGNSISVILTLREKEIARQLFWIQAICV